MAEKSGFFDAHLVNGEYDRVYLAESFAKYFASFIGNGVFGGKSNELMVQQKSTPDMSVRVLTGQGWINGYWYENDNELSLAIDVADGVLNRIDLIVLRWDNVERVIRLAVKKGVPASNPSAPTIQRDADYYELKLAQILIKAGSTRITQLDITDTRLDESVCGLVVGVVQQLDTKEFGKQLGAFVQEFIEHSEDWFSEFENNSNAGFNTFLEENDARVSKFISDNQANINNVISTGQQNINKVTTDGNAALSKLVSEGQASINSVVTTGQQNISKVVTDGNAALSKVVSEGQANINNVVSNGEAAIDDLIEAKTIVIDEAISVNRQKMEDAVNELEEIAADNDLVGMKANLEEVQEKTEKLENLFIESNQYPGCFYRFINNDTEWINPPNIPGPEYLTTERWNGKSVYQRIVYTAALPNKTVMSIFFDAPFDKIISITGFAIDSDNNMHYQFPIILNGLTPSAVISFAEGDGGSGSDITINTNDDLSTFKGYITVKYTKE